MSEERIELDLNVTAPTFKLEDVFERDIDLLKYKSKKVFIGFFRHAGCPFCNLRIHFLQKHYEELQKLGLEMIFFFESTKEAMLRSSFHKDVSPIPLISDPEKIWYQSYGVEDSMKKSTASHLTAFIQTAIKAKLKKLPLHMMVGKESFSTIPAEFLLDEDLIIRKIYYAKGLTDRMSIDHVYDFAKAK